MKTRTRILVLVAFCLTAAVAVVAFARASDPWHSVSHYPATVEGLREASDVAVDPADGDIYVVERDYDRIVRFVGGDTSDPAKREVWGHTRPGASNAPLGEFESPEGVAVDSDGNVWVTESNGNRVQKLDEDGDFLLVLGGNQGSANGQFVLPSDAAVDASGNVYVADTGNARIQKFDSEGTWLANTPPGAFGGFGEPRAVATDGTHVWATGQSTVKRFSASDLTASPTDDGSSLNAQFTGVDVLGGAVFASDAAGKVHKYTIADGWQTHELTDNNAPSGLDAATVGGDDFVFISDENNPHVRRLTTDFSPGPVVETRLAYPGPEQLFRASGVAADAAGRVWAVEGEAGSGVNYHRVSLYNADGSLAERFGADGGNGSEGDQLGEFSYPSDAAVSGSDVYVSDAGNHRIQRYDGTDWTEVAGPAGGFDFPDGIATQGADLYVADSTYGDSQVWRLSGGTWENLGLPNQVDGDFAQDVAADADGNVYVAVGNNDDSRILKRAGDGTWSTLANHGDGDGEVRYPRSIAFANGHLLIADTNNGRVQQLAADGSFVRKWGSDRYPAICAGDIPSPYGIAVSADGNQVYVADRLGNGISKFSFDGPVNASPCDTQAPIVTIGHPLPAQSGVAATPTFTGYKGTEVGDLDTVRLRVFRRAPGSAALKPVGQVHSVTVAGDTWEIDWQDAPLADGEYWVRVQQSDQAGNVGHSGHGPDEWGMTRFTVGAASAQTPAPTMDVLTATNDRTPNLGGTATNQADDSSVEIKIYAGTDTSGPAIRTMTTPRNGTNWSLADEAWAPAGGQLADGVYTAQASQTNNLATPDQGFSQARTFEVDTTAPEVNLANPSDDSFTTSTRPAISGTAGSKGGLSADTSITFQLQRQTPGGYVPVHQGSIQNGFFSVPKPTSGSSFSTTVPENLADGTYHLRAYQDDTAGNSNSQDTRSSRLVTVDTQAPSINLGNPGDLSQTTDPTPAIDGTAGNARNDGDLRFELNRWNGSTWVNHHNWTSSRPTSSTSFSTEVPVSLSPGTYHLRAYQADSLGHEAAQGPNSSRQFDVKPMFNPPVLRVTSPSHLQSFNSARPTISGTSDTAGEVAVELQRWNGSTWVLVNPGNYYRANVSNGFWSVTVPHDLQDGTYNIFVYQTNLGGQTSNSPGVWFTIDRTAPAKPTIDSPRANTKISDQQPTFAGKADPNGQAQVHIQLQGYAGNKWVVLKDHTVNRNGNAWSFKPQDYKLNSGYFTLFAYQYDAAGNVSISDGSQFQVDTTPNTPDNPGTDNNACQKTLEYGPIHVEGSCLKREGLTWVSTAKVTFNGLHLQPEGGNAKIILDPFNLRVAGHGKVKVVLGPSHFCLEDPTKIISNTCFFSYTAGPFTLYEASNGFDWSWQGKVQLPDIPRFGLPSGKAANLPSLPGLSGFNLPNLEIPGWGSVALPDFSKIKGPDIGKLTLPSLNAPNIKLPDNYFGNFKADIPRLSIGTSGAGNILGFPVEGRIGMRFADQGIYIDAGLKLPSILGGVTGDANLFVGLNGNMLAKDLRFYAGGFAMGPVGFRELDIRYSAASQLWEGSSWIDLPIPPGLAVKAGAGFKNGQLVNAEAGFEQNFPIGASGLFIYGGSIYFKTVPSREVGGNIALGLGPQVKGVSAVRVDTGIKYRFPDPGYQGFFELNGGVKVVNIPLANGFIRIYQEGDIDFGGKIGKDFGGGFVVEATVDGWIQKSKFNVDGTGKVHLGNWIQLDGEVTASHIGLGGCAKAKGFFGTKTFGATYKWSNSALTTMWDNCSVGSVKAKKSTAGVAAANDTVTVPAGQDAYVMGFKGAEAAPEVTLIGPKGERISTAGKAGLVDKRFLVIQFAEQKMTQVAIARPSAGAWKVQVDRGTVDEILTAETLDDPKIDAEATGRGAKRVLEYDNDTAPGERVVFAEVGPNGVESPIGEVAEGEGKLRFTPIAGPAGTRTIKASVTRNGVARFTKDRVTTFRASKPAIPGAPRVSAKRKKGKLADTLVARWTKVPGASSYRVTAVVSGRKKMVTTRKTSVRFAGLFARSSGSVSVQAVNALGQAGKAGKAKLKPPKPKHPPKKRKKKKKK